MQCDATDNGASSSGGRGSSEVTDFYRRMQQPGPCAPSPVGLQIVTGGMSPDLRMSEMQERVCMTRRSTTDFRRTEPTSASGFGCTNARKCLQKHGFPCSLKTDAMISNCPKYASLCSICLRYIFSCEAPHEARLDFPRGPHV